VKRTAISTSSFGLTRIVSLRPRSLSSIAWSSSSLGSRSSVTVDARSRSPIAPSGVSWRPARQDLERVEVEVDRVGVAGEVDHLPDLVLAQHREERGRVLEVGGGDAVARRLLAVRDGHQRPFVVLGGRRQLPHGQHVRLALHLPLDERDRTPPRAGEGVCDRILEVGRQLPRDRVAAHAITGDP
jgi:hypothetical protein